MVCSSNLISRRCPNISMYFCTFMYPRFEEFEIVHTTCSAQRPFAASWTILRVSILCTRCKSLFFLQDSLGKYKNNIPFTHPSPILSPKLHLPDYGVVFCLRCNILNGTSCSVFITPQYGLFRY